MEYLKEIEKRKAVADERNQLMMKGVQSKVKEESKNDIFDKQIEYFQKFLVCPIDLHDMIYPEIDTEKIENNTEILHKDIKTSMSDITKKSVRDIGMMTDKVKLVNTGTDVKGDQMHELIENQDIHCKHCKPVEATVGENMKCGEIKVYNDRIDDAQDSMIQKQILKSTDHENTYQIKVDPEKLQNLMGFIEDFYDGGSIYNGTTKEYLILEILNSNNEIQGSLKAVADSILFYLSNYHYEQLFEPIQLPKIPLDLDDMKGIDLNSLFPQRHKREIRLKKHVVEKFATALIPKDLRSNGHCKAYRKLFLLLWSFMPKDSSDHEIINSISKMPFWGEHPMECFVVSGGGGNVNSGVFNGLATIKIKNGEIIEELKHDTKKKAVMSVAAHPEEPEIACCINEDCGILKFKNDSQELIKNNIKIRIWDAKSRQEKAYFAFEDGEIYNISFNKENDFVAVTSKQIFFFEKFSPEEKPVEPSSTLLPSPGHVIRSGVFNDKGDLFVLENEVSKKVSYLLKYNASLKLVKRKKLHVKPATCILAFKGYVVVGFSTGIIKLFSQNLKYLHGWFNAHTFSVTSLAYNCLDNQLMSVSADASLFIYSFAGSYADFCVLYRCAFTMSFVVGALHNISNFIKTSILNYGTQSDNLDDESGTCSSSLSSSSSHSEIDSVSKNDFKASDENSVLADLELLFSDPLKYLQIPSEEPANQIVQCLSVEDEEMEDTEVFESRIVDSDIETRLECIMHDLSFKIAKLKKDSILLKNEVETLKSTLEKTKSKCSKEAKFLGDKMEEINSLMKSYQ
ncbi:hypothetical protein O9G_001418 [Rozella allomycis CSF55]|uniref:WD40 repeat-like protein n=1 Tax=Rozella allomycis (strain CSF55) TaxID=988480 RepID=A0A075B300_ROZAC|nr:hypothetical protein O9G_001418 [Rozella allomycis CSF55]|eukprot:EPZ36973.1 hypothetical protein O9G_001418 [Rozella allomycis CSF55]